MKKIPGDTVLGYWHTHQARTPDDIFHSLRKLYDQQYALMDYVMKAEGDGFNQAEHQTLYYLGSFIIGVMMQEFPAIPQVPEQVMAQARQSNVSMLMFLGTDERPQDIFLSMEDILKTHPQADMLRFLFTAVMNDKGNVREEKAWFVFTHLKIVIDALAAMTS